MFKNNPDFPTVDLETHRPGPTGWGVEDLDGDALLDLERAQWEQMAPEPVFQQQTQEPIAQVLMDKWIEFQVSKGRGRESNDMSILDDFVTGEKQVFRPQGIGSCVASNGGRAWGRRSLWQSCFYGGERLGTDELGKNSVLPYLPISYGLMRERGGLRRGDGGFCSAMAESFVRDGVVPCDDPTLLNILQYENAVSVGDFPECQSNSLYRTFGNWKYNDQLRPVAKYKLEECFRIRDPQHLWDTLMQGKPVFKCSMEALHHVGTHPDGFKIAGINPRDRWAHCMEYQGCFTSSDGERWFVDATESWTRSKNDGDRWLFYRRWDSDFERQFRNQEAYGVGQISGLQSSIPLVGE